jgi:hypothetical protein
MSSPRTLLDCPAIVTPVGTKRPSRKASLKLWAHKGKKEQVKFPKLPQINLHPQQLQQPNEHTVEDHQRKAIKISKENGNPITTIMRKKFSWKNYPGTFVVHGNHTSFCSALSTCETHNARPN